MAVGYRKELSKNLGGSQMNGSPTALPGALPTEVPEKIKDRASTVCIEEYKMLAGDRQPSILKP